jgi:hypothetical protein
MVHCWVAIANPFPHVYTIYMEREEPYRVASTFSWGYYAMAELSQSANKSIWDLAKYNDRTWDIDIFENNADGVDYVSWVFNTPAKYDLGTQEITCAIASEAVEVDGVSLSPTSLAINVNTQVLRYKHKDAVPVALTYTGNGRSGIPVNGHSVQYGYGDAWLTWDENDLPLPYAYEAYFVSDDFVTVPLSGTVAAGRIDCSFNLFHDLARITRRMGWYEQPSNPNSAAYSDWFNRFTARRTLVPHNFDKVGISVVTSVNRDAAYNDVLVYAHLGSSGGFRLLHKNDTFVNFDMGLHIPYIQAKAGDATYRLEPSEQYTMYDSYVEPLTGNTVGTFSVFTRLVSPQDENVGCWATQFVEISDAETFTREHWVMPNKPIIHNRIDLDMPVSSDFQFEFLATIKSMNTFDTDDIYIRNSGGYAYWGALSLNGDKTDHFPSKFISSDVTNDEHYYVVSFNVPAGTRSFEIPFIIHPDMNMLASESTVAASVASMPPVGLPNVPVLPQEADDVYDRRATNRVFSTELDTENGFISIVSNSKDSEDPFTHLLLIGCKPHPFIYSGYYNKNESQPAASIVHVEFLSLGELTNEDHPLNYVKMYNVDWQIFTTELTEGGANLLVVTLRAARTLEIGEQLFTFILSDIAHFDDAGIYLDPTVLHISYFVEDFTYEAKDGVPCIWISTHGGRSSYAVSGRSIQFGFGDAWFGTTSDSIPADWVADQANHGQGIHAYPISKKALEEDPGFSGYFFHDLARISKRRYQAEELTADPFTETAYFQDWASRRFVQEYSSPLTGDYWYKSMFTGSSFPEHSVVHINPYFDIAEFVFENDDFAAFYASINLYDVYLVNNTYYPVRYSPIFDTVTIDKSSWKDPDSGAIVYTYTHSVLLEGGFDNSESTIIYTKTFSVATAPVTYNGVNYMANEFKIDARFDFSESNKAGYCYFYPSYEVRMPNVYSQSYYGLSSPHGNLAFGFDAVDGVAVGGSWEMYSQHEQDLYTYQSFIHVPENVTYVNMYAVVNVDVAKVITSDTISTLKNMEEYLPFSSLPYYESSTMDAFEDGDSKSLVIDVANAEVITKNTHIIVSRPSPSIVAYSYKTYPFNHLYEFSFIRLLHLWEREPGAKTSAKERRIVFSDSQEWDGSFYKADDGQGNEYVHFEYSTWINQINDNNVSHPFAFTFKGLAWSKPTEFNNLHISIAAPFYSYSSPSSYLEAEFSTERFLDTEMDAVFTEFGGLNDAVLEGVLRKEGPQTFVRLHRNGDDSGFIYSKEFRIKKVV